MCVLEFVANKDACKFLAVNIYSAGFEINKVRGLGISGFIIVSVAASCRYFNCSRRIVNRRILRAKANSGECNRYALALSAGRFITGCCNALIYSIFCTRSEVCENVARLPCCTVNAVFMSLYRGNGNGLIGKVGNYRLISREIKRIGVNNGKLAYKQSFGTDV